MESGPSSCADANAAGQMKALPQMALKKIAGRSHIRTALPTELPSI